MDKYFENLITKSTTVKKTKQAVQDLVRMIAIKRDGGCIFRNCYANYGFKPCSSMDTKDGHLVLQADHLITRGKNIGYADTELIICLCQGHHTAKTFDNTGNWEKAIAKEIGPERCELWEAKRKPTKPMHMTLWDWQQVVKDLIIQYNNI